MVGVFVLAAVVAGGVVTDRGLVTNVEERTVGNATAFRYVIPTGATVRSEATEWTFPVDCDVWYQESANGYEKQYVGGKVGDIPVGARIGLPLTLHRPDGKYEFVSEANLVDWTDLAVEYRGEGRFVALYHAQKEPFTPQGTVSPWRVSIVADDLQGLATSTAIRDLCPEPPPERARKAKDFAIPGRCTWQWLSSGDPVYAEQRSWYDRTRELGWEYYLIDDGWKTWRDGVDDQWACLGKVIDYGKSIGVKTAIWVDSKEMPDRASRLRYLTKVRDAGAVGIKIDFMPPCDFKTCRWYEETLEDTFELGLFVDFHGAVKPTGREKTWPHELAREAVRGHEWHVTRYRRIQDFAHDTILPFHRLVQGHADYTPVVLEPMQLMRFTLAHELAQGVVFSCPFLCFGDRPENYLKSPAAWFLKELPATYDEVRVFPCSEIGEVAAVAKRKGEVWFVGVLNGARRRTVTLDFSFLTEGSCFAFEGFGDAPKYWSELTDLQAKEFEVRREDKVEIVLSQGGGFVGRLRKVR